ncbi:MAG: hypothetical protein Q7R79_04055, partial [bacterium]|nr:hypothetical protein [bacterium]
GAVYAFTYFKSTILRILFTLTSIFIVYKIRFYQGVLFLFSTILALTRFRFSYLKRTLPLLLILAFGSFFFLKFLLSESITAINPFEIMAGMYPNGSHMAPSLPFPAYLLQIFRPFPWEAKNLLALAASLELMVVLFIVTYLVVRNFRVIISRIQSSKVHCFLASWTIVALCFFSLESNLGDLARRKIYILPFLFMLIVK